MSVLFTNVRILDGTGAQPYAGDVLVEGNRIARGVILDSPMGLENYVATLKLTPVTDGNRTFDEWSAEFDCPPDREKALAEQIGHGVFQTALANLKTLVRR